MSAPSEPEKYSIDEMMERLKNRPAEDSLPEGELVTRADGTTAVRVRKRKRRSHQPHKEERKHHRRASMIQVAGALILLLLVVFAVGAAIVYANSAPFRESLIKKIGSSSGATVDLRRFRMNPTSANAGALTLAWPEGNALKDIALREIRAEVFPASFLGTTMVGEEVTAADVTLNLRIPNPAKPVRETQILDAPLPIRFKRYASSKFHLVVGESAAPLLQMMNSEASFLPETAGGRAQLLLNRGDISISGMPKLRLDRAHIEFRGSEVDIVGLRLRYDADTEGVFELSGTVSPYATDKASTLVVDLANYPLSGLAGTEFAKLFSGRIDTLSSAKSNYLSFTPGTNTGTSLAVEFRNSLGGTFKLSGFPFLFGLAQTLDNKWYASPVFESDVSGALHRAAGNLRLSDLNFENKDYMALKGSVQMGEDRRLSGILEVGIADAMIRATQIRRLDAMFGPTKEGFRWISLKIGGTAVAPTDNFRALFDAAVTSAAAPPVDKIPSFEDLTQPE